MPEFIKVANCSHCHKLSLLDEGSLLCQTCHNSFMGVKLPTQKYSIEPPIRVEPIEVIKLPTMTKDELKRHERAKEFIHGFDKLCRKYKITEIDVKLVNLECKRIAKEWSVRR